MKKEEARNNIKEKKLYNIFTDGAAWNNGGFNINKPVLSSSAYVITDADFKIIEVNAVFNGNNTNNYSELNAIYSALVKFNKYIDSIFCKRTDIVVNIYSDSILSITSLRLWWKKWWTSAGKSFNEIWYNSSGAEVANQDIIKSIILNFILDDKFSINMFYIPGHVNIKNEKSVNKAKNMFEKSNNTIVDILDFKDMLAMNNLCDKSAKECILLNLSS